MNKKTLQLLKDNENLIKKIASKFYGLEFEDLFQAGVIGLIKASRNFKEGHHAKFSTYAYDYIFGEMYALSMVSKNIRINKETLSLCRKIEEARVSLTQIINRIPTNYELASFLEMDEGLITNTLNAALSILSLDAHREEEGNIYETLPDEKVNNIDERIIIKDSMQSLDSPEKDIIYYRYFKDLTQSETAKTLGMTQAMISRYEKASLEKMGQYIAS